MAKKHDGNFGYTKSFLSFVPHMTDFDTGIRIQQQAHGLFMQYGLRSVSMDDIATNLGISKKTIYQYYADKDELIVAVVNEVIEGNELGCDADRHTSANAVHEVFLAMDMIVAMFRTMNPSLLYDMQKYHPKAFVKFLNHKNDYLFNVVRENIERGIREELYRHDIKIDIIARYRIESIMLPFNPEFHGKVKSSLAEIQEEIIFHFLFGLATLKGYKFILKYQQERLKNNDNAKRSV